MKKHYEEFKKFIARGSVMDLAVGVVIGTAFGAITKSLVDDVIMPPLGLLIGGVEFENLGIILKDPEKYETVALAIEAGAPVLRYGAFINTIINFLIIALAMFVAIRVVNKLMEKRRREEEDPAGEAEPPRDIVLLTEIRDLLAEQGSTDQASAESNASP